MSTPSSSAGQREHFLKLLRRFRTVMLSTHTGEHGIHSRPMVIADLEEDGRLWFITSSETAKVHEIEHDSEVALTAQEGDSAFLALSGRASLVDDAATIARLWREPFRVWFPEGKDDPALELISVRPERAEFWDNTDLNRCKYLWEAAKAYATGTEPEIEEGEQHGTVRL